MLLSLFLILIIISKELCYELSVTKIFEVIPILVGFLLVGRLDREIILELVYSQKT